MNTTEQIKQLARTRLKAFLEQQGFALIEEESDPDDESDSETINFRRRCADKFEFVAIQFEKHGRPRFILEAGECPANGVDYDGTHVPAEELVVASLFRRVRLQAQQGAFTRSWFRADHLLDRFRPQSALERVYQDVGSAFPQLEEWFRSKSPGPNLHGMDLRTPDRPF